MTVVRRGICQVEAARHACVILTLTALLLMPTGFVHTISKTKGITYDYIFPKWMR